MFNTFILVHILALILVFCGQADSASGESDFRSLKTLAGDWSFMDPNGEPMDLRGAYQVIAGGSAVIETLLAGTPEETVTIYYLDGNQVAATQLSGRSAPIRLVRRDTNGTGTLRFESKDERFEAGRLARLQLTLIDEERLRIEWSMAKGKEGLESRVFELKRESSIEELATEVARLRVDLESLQRELDRRIKREITVRKKGEPTRVLLETRTIPPGSGWTVSGVPMRHFLHGQTIRYATTYASKGDKGMTVAHYGFNAGPKCKLRFSVLGGHAYIAVVEEEKAPPRRIASIPEFSEKLESGAYEPTIERIAGGHWTDHPRAVEWDLSRFE